MKYIIERENYENSSDELVHWKYIDKKKLPSGKYRYIYDKSKRTVNNEKIRRKAQEHYNNREKPYADELNRIQSDYDKTYANFIKEHGDDPNQWDDFAKTEAEIDYAQADFDYRLVNDALTRIRNSYNNMLYFANTKMPEIAGKVKDTIKKIDLKKVPGKTVNQNMKPAGNILSKASNKIISALKK